MKAIISSSHDDKYYYFIPIVVYLWKKLGVDVICFTEGLNFPMVTKEDEKWVQKAHLVEHYTKCSGLIFKSVLAPKNKMCTYLQCSRLYGACLDLPEDEVLITSDIDMAVFKLPPMEQVHQLFSVFGADLVPEKQSPICYQYATVKEWRKIFKLYEYDKQVEGFKIGYIKSYQQCLDSLLSEIECENMRGNYWSKDQQESYDRVTEGNNRVALYNRARPNTQFADHRVDRDDVNWRAYVNDELIDAHLWRDGYTEQNHANIMELMRMKFPDEDFEWLDNFRQEYIKLL